MTSNSRRKWLRATIFLLAIGGVSLVSTVDVLAQDGTERPSRLESKDGDDALRAFAESEQELTRQRNDKKKDVATKYAKAHKKLRSMLIAELKDVLETETKSGNLDEAIEVRDAIRYFEKLESSVANAQADEALGELVLENESLRSRIDQLESALEMSLAKQVAVTNSLGMEFRMIPAGKFRMGNELSLEELGRVFRGQPQRLYANSSPAKEAVIDKPFLMGTYEVTVAQFRKFVADTGYETVAEVDSIGGNGYDGKGAMDRGPRFNWKNTGFEQAEDHPVVNIAWVDALQFCKWLSKKEGVKYSLPSEAQWEYACRAGTTTMYYNGDQPQNLNLIGNAADSSYNEKVPGRIVGIESDGCAFTRNVGRYSPNKYGLYDMYGNAAEWCSDQYVNDYSESVDPDGLEPARGWSRPARGGGWNSISMSARSAARFGFDPRYVGVAMGFRVIRTVKE